MRTHVSLPEDLLREIDRLAGPRRRSQFVEEAVRAKLRQAAQAEALARTAGTLRVEDYPEWTTPADVSRWVERLREESNDRRSRPRD